MRVKKTAVLIVALFLALGSVMKGIALVMLWKWFVAPLGVPVLSLFQAVGIALIWEVLTETYHESPSDIAAKGLDYAGEKLGGAITSPLVALLFGWFLTLAMSWSA